MDPLARSTVSKQYTDVVGLGQVTDSGRFNPGFGLWKRPGRWRGPGLLITIELRL